MYKYLLFDGDDTLFDFKKTEKHAFILSLEAFNIPYSEAVFETYKKINHGLWTAFEKGEIEKNVIHERRFKDLLEALKVDKDGDALSKCYIEKLAQGSYLFEDALDLCKELSKNHQLYLCTNGFSYVQHTRFNASPIKEYFKDIFVSEDSGFQKPQKAYFDYVFERIPNFKLEEALLIGDSLSSDMMGGLNASIKTCWYNPNQLKNDPNIPIDYEINALKAL
ncbi:MAG: YjjG family noncanonical pyrimidine nucleotidase, partial [Erysipelotrichaceae bacterium]